MSIDKSKDCKLPPSDDFERAFENNSSGCVRTCACGRTLFDACNSYDWDEGELEGLLEKSKASPEEYIALDYAAQTAWIEGQELVLGCPCNRLRAYEDFIVKHAIQIAEYLNAHAAELESRAQQSKVNINL